MLILPDISISIYNFDWKSLWKEHAET